MQLSRATHSVMYVGLFALLLLPSVLLALRTDNCGELDALPDLLHHHHHHQHQHTHDRYANEPAELSGALALYLHLLEVERRTRRRLLSKRAWRRLQRVAERKRLHHSSRAGRSSASRNGGLAAVRRGTRSCCIEDRAASSRHRAYFNIVARQLSRREDATGDASPTLSAPTLAERARCHAVGVLVVLAVAACVLLHCCSCTSPAPGDTLELVVDAFRRRAAAPRPALASRVRGYAVVVLAVLAAAALDFVHCCVYTSPAPVDTLELAVAAFRRLTAGGCVEENPGPTCWLVTGGAHCGTIVTTSWTDVEPLVIGVSGGSSRRCANLEEATRVRDALSLPPPAATAGGRRARSATPPRDVLPQLLQHLPATTTPPPTTPPAATSPAPKATRFWAVRIGRKRGVFLSWDDGAFISTDAFPDARHHRFSSLAAAADFAGVNVVYDTFHSEGRPVDGSSLGGATPPPATSSIAALHLPAGTSSPPPAPRDHAPAASASSPPNVISGLALADSKFDDLTRQNVEKNPGPPAATGSDAAAAAAGSSPRRTPVQSARATALKRNPTMTPDQSRYYNLDTRTNGQRQQHKESYQWGANNLYKMKKNDIFFLSMHEENTNADELPHPTRHFSVALLALTGDTITVRFPDSNKMIIAQWHCMATELGASAGTNTRAIVFPLAKEYKESEERVCYMKVSTTQYSTEQTNVMWQRVAVTSARPNFDRDQCTVMRRAPRGTDRDAFCDRVARIVALFDDARTRNDQPAVINIWHQFLSAPKMMLRCLKGDAPSRLRSRYIQQQLASPGAVLEQVSIVRRTRADQDGVDETVCPDDAEEARLLKRKKRLDVAKRHTINGFASKGAAHLQQDELPAQSPATKLKNLQDLHPQGNAGNQPIFVATPTVNKLPVNISDADLLALIKSSISGAAPGSTAWTEEMLYDVCLYSVTAMRGIKLMLTSIVNNDAPACVRERLLTGELLGIPKPDGSTRPIALTEVMLKIASKLAVAADLKKLKGRFAQTQYGVCAPRGADTVICATRDFIRHAETERDATATSTKCVVTIDFKNAFNCPSRRMMVDAIAPFPYLLSMFRFEYETPSKLYVRGAPNSEFIWSACGTRQGSTLGPVFFCLAIQNMLDDLNRMPGIRAMAYMDDLTIHAQSFEHANLAYGVLLQHAESLNLAVNTKKCEIMAHTAPSDNICPSFARVSVVKLLGASIGLTNELEKKHLEKRYDGKFAEWFDTLIGGYGSWASTILGVCGVPKLSYLVRNHHPYVTRDLARAFDKQVETVWSTWAECRTDDITQSFAHLPIKLGGLGFTRQEQVAASCYNNARVQYEGAICAAASPAAVENLATMQVNLDLANKIDASSPGAKRHRQLCMQNGTAALFRVATHEPRHSSFGAAIRYRLYAPHANCPDQIECPGCSRNCDAREFMTHAPSCTRIHGHNASTRHANLKQAWLKLLRRYLIPHQMQEPRDMRLVECPGCKTSLTQDKWRDHAKACALWDDSAVPPDGSGPDIRIFLSDRREFDCTVIDVTCIGLENATHSAKELQTAFKQVEEKKRKLYGKLCADNNAQLIIAAISDSGIPSAESIELLRAIIAQSTDSYHDVIKELQAAAVESNGASLYNAESRAGIPHAHRTREDTKASFTIVATPAVATAARSADGAAPAAAAPAPPPPSSPPPPAPLRQPVPPPLQNGGNGWATHAINPHGRIIRRQRETSPTASPASADAAGSEPDPRPPTVAGSSADVDSNGAIRHGRSPIPANDNHVWNGDLKVSITRANNHFGGNSCSTPLGRQVRAAMLHLQTRNAGVYFSLPLYASAAGPLVTVLKHQQFDKMVVSHALSNEWPNIRATMRFIGITNNDGIIQPLSQLFADFYGQSTIDAHFNSQRSVDEGGMDNGERIQHPGAMARGDAAE